MTRSGERDLSRIGGLDYALVTSGSCLAAFSAGMALQDVAVSLCCILGIVIGASFSYVMRVSLLQSRFLKLDAFLYPMAVSAGIIFEPRIATLLPDGGYPPDVIAAGWLTTMLLLGSFFTWQDATLLFQAVPSIALFGLAGIYSTWSGVNFAFFGFLMCLATLVARAHRRAMLVQAAESGYFTRGLAPGSIPPSVETTPGLARRMLEGPWKWIAGPEWALISALAIILVSLLGAPSIERVIKPVSGFAKIGIPQSIQKKLRSQISQQTQEVVSVGQGPNPLQPTPEFEIRTDPADAANIQYVRSVAYYSFSKSSHQWSVMSVPQDQQDAQQNVATVRAINEMDQNVHSFPFEVRLRLPLAELPTPGLVEQWNGDPLMRVLYDGRFEIQPSAVGQVYSGQACVTKDSNPTTAVWDDLPPIFDETKRYDLSPRVVARVKSLIRGAKNDYEKAERIREFIANTVTYNINAPAVPAGTDPVDDVLFDHPQAYCDMYATAMTLTARCAGIPARIMFGYHPELSNTDGAGWTVALASDYHAWAELYFKGYGWVIFDATDGTRSVPDAGRGSWNAMGPVWSRPWVGYTIDGLIGVCLASAGFILLRARSRSLRAGGARRDLDREYVAFTRMLERKVRTRRRIDATPDEFLAEVREPLGPAYALAAELNQVFVHHFYSPRPTTDGDLAAVRARLKKLRLELKARKQPALKGQREST